MRFRLLLLFILSCLLLSSASAQAPQPTGDNRERAAKLYEEAESFYNLQEYEKALASFQEAYRLSSEPSILYSLGQCYRRLRRYEEALTAFQNFLRDAPESPLHENAKARISELTQLLSEESGALLVISSSADPADVYVAQEYKGKTPLQLRSVPAGEQLITLKKEGYALFEQKLTIEPRQEYFLRASLTEAPSAKPPPTYLAPALLGGAGLLLGGVAGGLFLTRDRRSGEAEGLTAAVFAISADVTLLSAGASATVVYLKRKRAAEAGWLPQ